MTEGDPVYFVEPSEPEEYVEKGATLIASSIFGLSIGATGYILRNPEVGIAVGISFESIALGTLFSMDSARRAFYAARTGKTIRAYLRVTESALEGAFAGAVPAAITGYQTGSVEGAIITGVAGGVVGGLVALALLRPHLSQAFRERNQLPVAITT